MTEPRRYRLSTHPYTHCYVEVFGEEHENGTILNRIDFYSYRTLVISINFDIESRTGYLECTGTHSRSTARQMTWFLRELYLEVSYKVLKDIANSEIPGKYILDDYSVTRCYVTANDYWKNGKPLNYERYVQQCKEAEAKW